MVVKSQNQIKTGLRSLELYYEPVFSTQIYDIVAFRTHLRINDPDMGVLLPNQYKSVAQRSNQAVKLAQWALEEVVKSISVFKKRGVFCEWISVDIPTKLLKNEDFLEQIEQMLRDKNISSEKLRFELSSDILYEEYSAINVILEKLKQLGIRCFISGFATEFCPVLRIGDFNVDGVIIDETVTMDLCAEFKIESLLSLFTMLKSFGKYIVLCGVNESKMVDMAIENEIPAYTGMIVGKQRRISSIR